MAVGELQGTTDTFDRGYSKDDAQTIKFTFISLSYQDLWSMVVDNPEQDHNNVHRVGHPGGGAQTGLPPHTLPGKVSANLLCKIFEISPLPTYHT